MEEPFRWLIDVSVVQAFELGTLDLRDFYFTGDDYRYRFEPETKQRFVDLIRERFNAGTDYKGRVLKWETIIEQKATELGRFLVGKSSTIDFAEPAPKLEGADDREIRTKILALTSSEAKQLRIRKSTFHYLRHKAEGRGSFTVYRPVLSKLGSDN